MPGARDIAEGLERIANEGVFWAIGWHFLAFGILLALLFGWRPNRRAAGLMMVAPIVSVSAFAFTHANPFNGIVFAALALGLLAIVARASKELPPEPTAVAQLAGAVMIAFGLLYPHFLDTRPIVSYVFAAPTGLLPCPTLAAVIGFTLLAGGLGSRLWSSVLAASGLLYGLFGAAQLGVLLDWGLVVGAAVLLMTARTIPKRRRVRRLSERMAHA